MKRILSAIMAMVAAGALSLSCTSYLETTSTTKVSDIMAWSDQQYTDLYVNSFYTALSSFGQFGGSQFNGNMTEGLTNTLKYGSPTPGSHYGDSNNYLFYPERITPQGSLLDIWSGTYNGIRRINEFLVSLKKYSTYSESVNLRYEAQARFFRAYLYFQLARRHCNGNMGGVVLYDNVDFVKDKAHATEAETWDFIARDLDFAAANLPTSWDGADAGRVTKYMAYALKSRVMLYAERWEDAIEAADSVILHGGYSLVADYADSWKGDNSESIIQFKYSPASGLSHTHEIYHVPYGDFSRIGEAEIGGTATPTQEMVEMYEDKNGNPVDWSAWHVAGPVAARPDFENLEPRFQATVLYNGCAWKGGVLECTPDGEYGRYMDYRADSYPNGRTVTGYYLRKFLEATTDDAFKSLVVGNGKRGGATWVEMRLAEVYLNRAEALYHTGGDALADINTVRARVNLPAKSGITGDALFNLIRKERTIELSYEGHLWWDMRRWKLAATEYNNYRCHGLKPDHDAGNNLTFQYVDVDGENRKFPARLYILPIPTSETNNNSLIVQYPEWL